MNNIVLNISINKSDEHSVLVIVQRYVAQLHNRHNNHSILSALLRDLNSWKRKRNNMSGKINTLKIVLNRIERLQDYGIKKREIQYPILKSNNHINLVQTKGARLINHLNVEDDEENKHQ